ncbi:MAG TPA: AMMECR1 domain-containing protein, partial [Fimbriimonadaceae bacterium]|nr:AMMECR1 domain-containing protein [Fimbriimonadaceae bacterium]
MLAALLIRFAPASNYDQQKLIQIARDAVVAEVRGAPILHLSHGELPVQPVFVTIEVNGVVRGCRGSLATRTASLEDEIRIAARGAAEHDPRYKPLGIKELGQFLVTVTIVDRKEPIVDVASLTPEEGLALRSGDRWGIVLPWEGKDPQIRLKWAFQKAGLPVGSPAVVYRLYAT